MALKQHEVNHDHVVLELKIARRTHHRIRTALAVVGIALLVSAPIGAVGAHKYLDRLNSLRNKYVNVAEGYAGSATKALAQELRSKNNAGIEKITETAVVYEVKVTTPNSANIYAKQVVNTIIDGRYRGPVSDYKFLTQKIASGSLGTAVDYLNGVNYYYPRYSLPLQIVEDISIPAFLGGVALTSTFGRTTAQTISARVKNRNKPKYTQLTLFG